MVKKPWTSLEERELVELVRDGTTVSEVGEILGRTKASCQCKLHQLGVRASFTGRRMDLDRALVIASLLDTAQLSVSGVARRLGVKEPSVRKTVVKLVSMGALVRTGGATRKCRYKIPTSWKKASGRACKATWTDQERDDTTKTFGHKQT